MDEPIEYPIRDHEGKLWAIHQRVSKRMQNGEPVINAESGKPEKDFFWLRPDGQMGLGGVSSTDLPLYRAEDTARWNADTSVILTEGEKAADSLRTVGLQALATTTGAGTIPSDKSLQVLQRFQVYIWPDNDAGGEEMAAKIAKRLIAMGNDPRILRWDDAPYKGDAADLTAINNGTAKTMIEEMMVAAPLAGFLDGSATVEDSDDEPVFFTADMLVERFIQEADEIEEAARSGELRWISSGFPRLDELIDGGFKAGNIYAVHAQAGIGKSAFVLQVATQSQVPVLLVTVEMDELKLTKRMVAQATEIPVRRILNNHYSSAEEAERVRQVLAKQQRIMIVDAGKTIVRTAQMAEKLEWLQERHDSHGLALLIIDSFNHWLRKAVPDSGKAEHEVSIEGIMALRRFAKKHKVPILLVWERTKQSMNPHAFDPGMNSMAGGRTAQYEPDVILGLDYPPKKKGDPERDETEWVTQRELVLRANKNREGPSGAAINYIFDGSIFKFRELG